MNSPSENVINDIIKHFNGMQLIDHDNLQEIINKFLDDTLNEYKGVTETAKECDISTSRVRQLAEEIPAGRKISGFLVFSPEDREKIKARNRVGGWTKGIPTGRRVSRIKPA